jgi:predicted nucleic acid-binding protein
VVSVLLDTNVLSELARPKPNARVLAFVAANADAHVSAITIFELTFGARRAPAQRRERLMAWVSDIRTQFQERIVPITGDIAAEAGLMRATAESRGNIVGAADALIAASARSRDAIIATRNVRDFRALDIALVDPWATNPGSLG